MTRSISISAGSEIVYVTGTVNGVAATWTLTAPNRWSTVVDRSPDDKYTIVLSAYDAVGNHTDYTITMSYGVNAQWDWTVGDYLNADDMNRIEGNVAVLRDLLLMYGYSVPITSRQEWVREDFPTRSEVDRIRANIDALQTGFYTLPDWREITYNNTLDFNQANAWEYDLNTIDVWLGRMVAAFMYSNEIYGGEV